MRHCPLSTWRLRPLCLVAVGWILVGLAATVTVGQESVPALVVRVALPLQGDSDTRIIASVDKRLQELPATEQRPLVVFELEPTDAERAGLSQFERALSLARYIASERFSRVRTVAYLPGLVDGHAVLPVLACEEIICAPDAQLGAAGRGETSIDPTMLAAYRELAERRRTIPVAMVMGMLDPAATVTEVQLVGGGTRYVLGDELESLRQEGKIGKETTIKPAGDFALLSGRELRLQFGFASHLAADRRELAEALKISPEALRDDIVGAGGWRALRIDLRGRITARMADDVTRAVRTAQADGTANLLCLWIDSSGGMPAPALRIFHLLGELPPRQMRTVAYVEGEARSLAALVALACDEVYAREDARLGGPGNTFLEAQEIADLTSAARQLAAARGRDWSLMAAMIDPDLEVFRCRREGSGVVRYFSEEERNEQTDPHQWVREEKIAVGEGITGLEARQFGVVRGTADNLQTVLQQLGVDQDIAVAQRHPVVAAIENLAAQPWFGRTLLFIAFFALISEASAPGIGVAGFVSTVCFLLFFWAQFLNGTAGWLELLLFGGGLACIALEIFVLPGFGVFGGGGVAMVLLSIVLASQTFILPRNSYQFDQIPGSLMSIVAAGGGVIASVWIMRRYLADSWLFRRLILTPPSQEEDLDRLEALVDWSYLEGKRGVTTTQLTPSGKARFGDDIVDVISDGVLVPKGTPVYVAQVRGNHVLVQTLDES